MSRFEVWEQDKMEQLDLQAGLWDPGPAGGVFSLLYEFDRQPDVQHSHDHQGTRFIPR